MEWEESERHRAHLNMFIQTRPIMTEFTGSRPLIKASLLSGYQKIAKKAGLQIASDSSPVEIAEHVLSWLQREQNWLVVIDNLDDIKVVDGFLPETGPHQHTLITTRNPNSAGIPAEGLEVPLLDLDDSVDLLSTLSNITIVSNSPESEQADQIVEKLGYLPLGIEQAAAYVREVAGDFVTFLKDYDENRRELHRWVPQGIRPYPHSVATTWSMSFKSSETITLKQPNCFDCYHFSIQMVFSSISCSLGQELLTMTCDKSSQIESKWQRL